MRGNSTQLDEGRGPLVDRMAVTTGAIHQDDADYGASFNLEQEVQDVFEATVGRGEAPNSFFNLVHKKDDPNDQERTPSMPSCSNSKTQN